MSALQTYYYYVVKRYIIIISNILIKHTINAKVWTSRKTGRKSRNTFHEKINENIREKVLAEINWSTIDP